MATNASYEEFTLHEIAQRQDKDGKLGQVVDVLVKNDNFIKDVVWEECNDTMTHVTRKVVARGGSTRKRFNRGTNFTSAATKKIRDVVTSREQWLRGDARELDIYGFASQFMDQEARLAISQMGEDMVYDFMYGGLSYDPDDMSGIMDRLGTINSQNVFDAGGTGSDVASLIFCIHGRDTLCGIYPKGTSPIPKVENYGQRTADVTENSKAAAMRVYEACVYNHYGLAVKDERAYFRVANIEVSGAVNKLTWEMVCDAVAESRNQGKGGKFYCNQKIWSQIYQLAANKANVYLTLGNPFGTGDLPMIMGKPVMTVESMLSSETAIS